ncbi:ArsR/SmtB family transcription factor [Bacillus sp. Marseille-P3661]|uniref:ArsR/SmtB family transcription factor n=1 Tax=Bacillus sp. Marseille-P3661 TaxID=1936234 RepID=UPI000C8563FE|nr:metalloregulator ArsR/SmtB family transcription factor [Bacillus sp. Marseille-P3661]
MSSKDSCDVFCFDKEKVNRIQNALMIENIEKLAKVYKVLADENRAKIAYALCLEDELCVCDVANIIQSSVATASHHLRTMKKMGLARFRKEGKLAFYSLDDTHVKQLILITLEHLKEGV